MDTIIGPSGPNYPIPVNPVYNPNIPSLLNTDRADARLVMNPWITPFFENIHAIKLFADYLQERSDTIQGQLDSFEASDFANFFGPFANVNEILPPLQPRGLYVVGESAPFELYLVINNKLTHVGATDIDFTNIYTKQEIENMMLGKADAIHQHEPSDIKQDFENRFVTEEQMTIWDTVLTHGHEPEDIIQNDGHRFVADFQILAWDGAVETLPSKEERVNKGIPGGYAELDEEGKVPMSQISDAILGQMVHAGEFNADTAVATLTSAGMAFLDTEETTITLTDDDEPITGFVANQGNFYIIDTAGEFASIAFLVGDWLVANSSGWSIISNSGAVSGVRGSAESAYRTGNVVIDKEDIGLGNVENFGIATQAEAESGIEAGKYMVPANTKQAILALARSVLMTGLSTETDEEVDEADTLIEAIGKLQAQIDSNKTQKYVQSFDDAEDWAGTNWDTFEISIPPILHQLGEAVTVDVYRYNGTDYIKTTGFPTSGFSVRVADSGDVTIETERRFAGRVVIV